jgi:hypothetical protein
VTTGYREGTVTALVAERVDLIRVHIDTETGPVDAVAFPKLTGAVAVGDRVIVNTLGIDLDLGTGGDAFVLWNLSRPKTEAAAAGHIVKLRYSPLQTNVLAAEAPESPHHEELREVTSIDGMPVVTCGLHAQVPAVAAGIKAARPGVRVAYVMNDAGALPLAWSDLVRTCRAADVLDLTCTYGHAFGGDLEAVNAFSALAAVRHAGDADAAIVGPGPGVVGTSTTLGFSTIDQGAVLDAASALGGIPIAALRISFADPRPRHRGVSRHSIVALTLGTRSRVTVAVPELPGGAPDLSEALRPLAERHELLEADGAPGLALLDERGVVLRSMGRSLEATPELFLAASAAGAVAAGYYL